MDKRDAIRDKALTDLQRSGVLMLDGHFDFGNGYHGGVYLNPHQLFRHPSTIWRFAQDLLDLLPAELLHADRGGGRSGHRRRPAGAHHRRPARQPPQPDRTRRACSRRSTTIRRPVSALREFYRREIAGRRVLLADDVRNTGETFARCAALVHEAGGRVIATVAIYDRMEAQIDLGVPHVALAEYKAPDNVRAADCVLCQRGVAITRF